MGQVNLRSTEREMSSQFQFFAACAPGLEIILLEQCALIGIKGTSHPGGVEWRGPLDSLWRANHFLGVAESIRIRLKQFLANDFKKLIDESSKIAWHAFLLKDHPYALSISCEKSKLFHSGAVKERLAKVLETKMGIKSVPLSEPHQAKIYVRLDRDRCTISLDSSGERLHKRGYREFTERASIRETLANAARHIAMTETLSPISKLADPFCGAGTLILEAAYQALPFAQRPQRSFAFEEWKIHPKDEYLTWLSEQSVAIAKQELQLFASDIREKAILSTTHNAQLLQQEIHTSICGAVEAIHSLPQGCSTITNPPYGERISDTAKLGTLYAAFESALDIRKDLRPVLFICGWTPFKSQSKLAWQKVLSTSNGGLPVDYLLLK